MIEDPPLITIAARPNRPVAAQIEALGGFPTGFLVDAMYGSGALPFSIKALSPGVLPQKFCGPALTVDPGPADVLTLVASLAEVEQGDVLVCATGGWTGCAAVGDRVLGMARNGGVCAFVTDGLVRDVDGIEQVGLPVYCAGVSPNSPYNSGPGTIGAPVNIGDRMIGTGDLLVGDRDGVVVVPYAMIDTVIERATHIAEIETELDAKVAQGQSVPPAIVELLASDKVRRL